MAKSGEGKKVEQVFLEIPLAEPDMLSGVTVVDLTTGQSAFVPDEAPARRRHAARGRDLQLVDVMVLMERPFFAFAGKPITRLPPYTSPNGKLTLNVEAVTPELGVATLRDADVLIYCASLIRAAQDAGRTATSDLILKPRELPRAVGRSTGGRQYELLTDSLERLRTTRVTTNIAPDGTEGPPTTFSFVETWADLDDGERGWTLRLCTWFMEAVGPGRVLSVDPQYFALAAGYERWLHRTAHKHAGQQSSGFTLAMQTLWKKSGSTSPYARFKFETAKLVEDDALPDFRLRWGDGHGPNSPNPKVEMRRRRL